MTRHVNARGGGAQRLRSQSRARTALEESSKDPGGRASRENAVARATPSIHSRLLRVLGAASRNVEHT